MSEVNALLSEAIALQAAVEDKKRDAAAKVAALRARILAGGTTGDPIQDFVLTRFEGLPASEQMARYREVNDALKGKSGQVVIGKFSRKVPGRHVFGQGTEYHCEDCYIIGLLEGDQLLFKRNGERMECELPLRAYAVGTDRFEGIRRGPLSEHVFGYFTMTGANIPTRLYDFGLASNIQLFIGDDENKALLESGFLFGFKDRDDSIPLLLGRLGRFRLEPSPSD